ncbi:MAG: efflux RND transporter periplasmic adaptor subunit, partial [Prolixibacteraceae bacterium]|nr:efflux RND transporter periplasmic adaptor subunit [Prolixibacteraceae bacterium]
MKNIKIFLLIGIVAGFVACNNQTQNEEADLAVPVTVEDIKPQSIQQLINTTGTVKATYETEISSEMSGNYQLKTNPNTGKPFKLGDRVTKGQVIVHFEDEEYLNNLNLEAKKLDLEISDNDYNKQSSLFEKGGVTESELRSAEVAKINSKNSYESAMISLSKMDVVAPFSGIIVDLPYYTPGSKVASGTPMFTLMNYDKMYMEINLPEKYISDVTLGQKTMITNYTIEEDTLYGQVSELSPAISSETRTFTGKLQIDNPNLKLRPGMFVKAD